MHRGVSASRQSNCVNHRIFRFPPWPFPPPGRPQHRPPTGRVPRATVAARRHCPRELVRQRCCHTGCRDLFCPRRIIRAASMASMGATRFRVGDRQSCRGHCAKSWYDRLDVAAAHLPILPGRFSLPRARGTSIILPNPASGGSANIGSSAPVQSGLGSGLFIRWHQGLGSDKQLDFCRAMS